MIRVIVADDQPLTRSSIAFLLGTHADVVVVAEADDGDTAVELTQVHKPDVAVLDYAMPRMNGALATAQIVSMSPATRVVIFSQNDSEELAEAVLNAGAKALVPKSARIAGLVQTIRDIAESDRQLV